MSEQDQRTQWLCFGQHILQGSYRQVPGKVLTTVFDNLLEKALDFPKAEQHGILVTLDGLCRCAGGEISQRKVKALNTVIARFIADLPVSGAALNHPLHELDEASAIQMMQEEAGRRHASWMTGCHLTENYSTLYRRDSKPVFLAMIDKIFCLDQPARGPLLEKVMQQGRATISVPTQQSISIELLEQVRNLPPLEQSAALVGLCPWTNAYSNAERPAFFERLRIQTLQLPAENQATVFCALSVQIPTLPFNARGVAFAALLFQAPAGQSNILESLCRVITALPPGSREMAFNAMIGAIAEFPEREQREHLLGLAAVAESLPEESRRDAIASIVAHPAIREDRDRLFIIPD